VLRRLRRAFEGDFGCLIAAGFAEDLAAQLQRVGMRLERERAVEREQRPIAIAQLVRGVAQLMPHEPKVGIGFHGPFQLGERLGIATELGERGAAQA
jgi:hypothetical protein